MGPDDLDSLERRFRGTGLDADHAAWLRARLELGLTTDPE